MTRIGRSKSTLIKLFVACCALIYVYVKLKDALAAQDAEGGFVDLLFNVPGQGRVYLGLAFVLVIFNLGFEALKWWNLQRLIYPSLSYIHSFQAVLVGMTTGIFTPNKVGEYAGRVFFLPEGYRIEATVFTFIDRISQMLVTLLMGGCAILALKNELPAGIFIPEFGSDLLVPLAILSAFLILSVSLFLFYRRKKIQSLRLDWIPSTLSSIRKAFSSLPITKIISTFLFSVLRYGVFTTQYILLMLAFGYEQPVFLAIGLTALVFLIKSLIPYIGVSELGIRESVAIHIMGLFNVGVFISFKSTFFLYVINVILPTLTGLFFSEQVKFRHKGEYLIYCLVILLSCLVFYAGYILRLAYYFRQLLHTQLEPKPTHFRVSVIIAARNEGSTIDNCLKSVLNQTLVSGQYEVFVVDDHSDDGTAKKVEEWMERFPNLKLIQLEKENVGHGKKRAIEIGINHAKGDIILTTDADCVVQPDWISLMVSPFRDPEVAFVAGPVSLDRKNPSVFDQFQMLEFMGLIAVGAASIQKGSPNMCNGANLGYRKQVFLDVNGFKGVDHLPSGDDEFLMHKIHDTGSWHVKFVCHESAIVSTSPMNSLGQFAHQRIRWVSKSTHYSKASITLTLTLSYIAMLSFPVLFAFSIWNPHYFWVLGMAFLLKIIPEGIILFLAAGFFGKLRLLMWLPFEQIFHVTYVLWVGVAGNLASYNWKGRKIK